MSGCMSEQQSVAADVDPAGWSGWTALVYENTDTLTRRNVSLSLRYNADASPREGTYYVAIASPSGDVKEDGVQVALDPATGNNLYEARVLLGSGVHFAESGRYVFNVKPAVPTFGVWSVALEIRPGGARQVRQ